MHFTFSKGFSIEGRKMKWLARLYATLNKASNSRRFDRLYQFDHDPFGIEDAADEQRKRALLLALAGRRFHAQILDIG